MSLIIFGRVLPIHHQQHVSSNDLHAYLVRDRPGTAYYAGVIVTKIENTLHPEGFRLQRIQATSRQKIVARQIVETLPETLTERMTPLGHYVIPCP